MSKPHVARKDLEISDAVGVRLAGALTSGHPATIAYVGADGLPHISHRGSLQRLNDRQLAVWARNPGGGLAQAMAGRTAVAVLYSDFSDLARRVLFNAVGRGRVEPDEAVRRAIYDNAPQIERQADPDRRGVAIVIDVDEISGYLDGQYVQMRRA